MNESHEYKKKVNLHFHFPIFRNQIQILYYNFTFIQELLYLFNIIPGFLQNVVNCFLIRGSTGCSFTKLFHLCLLRGGVYKQHKAKIFLFEKNVQNSISPSRSLKLEYILQVYPTPFRTTGVAASFFSGRIGAAVSPFISQV